MEECPKCGTEIDEGSKFCRQCGAPLVLVTEDAPTWRLPANTAPNPEPPRPTMPVAGNQTAPPGPATAPTYIPPVAYYEPPPPPVPYQARPPSGHVNISLSDWLSGGWQVYKENWLMMSLATAFGGFLSFISLGILAGPLLMGLYRMAFKTMRGERPDMNDLFKWEGRFLQAFLAFLIAAVIYFGLTGVGKNEPVFAVFSFLVVPFLTVLLGLALPNILERKMDVAAAINEVGRLVFSRDALMWWIVGLVFATITGGGMIAFCIGVFVTIPLVVSAMAVAYRDIFGIDDPNRTLP